MSRTERIIPIVSLFAVWALFHDYFPPFQKVHLWADIEGYHWPLLSYAYTSLREGRFPLWDSAIYCGIPFAGNIQAGLFYPPNWLLFAAQAHRTRILYTAVEALAVAHVWLAFIFGFLWLRERAAHWLPGVLGASVVGCSGYMLSQMHHLGVICGYAWMPFGLWGIEQASRQRHWHPLWKLALGLSMCLLAGYPPTFMAFCLIAGAYALALPGRRRLFLQVLGAAGFSLLLSAVQLLPALEVVREKIAEASFGSVLPDHPRFYLSFLLPNFYDQNRTGTGPEAADGDYMYLGAAAVFGLLYLVRRPQVVARILPGLVMVAVILLVIEDPGKVVSKVVYAMPVVPDILRNYNMLAGIPLAAALIVSGAVGDLTGKGSSAPGPRWISGWMLWGWMLVAAGGVLFLLYTARKGPPEFEAGIASAAYAGVAVALLWTGLVMYRASDSPVRAHAVAALLLLIVFAECRAFGVNRRFNAVTGNTDELLTGDVREGGS
ncbi:MAG: hypothetical protein ACRD7E_13740, partial [Bryobacteraceae bacterium]